MNIQNPAQILWKNIERQLQSTHTLHPWTQKNRISANVERGNRYKEYFLREK